MITTKSLKAGLYEFWIFGVKEARACIFAGSFMFLLAISNYIPLFGVPRYDFLFLGAVLLQAILILTKLETIDEFKTILLFHFIGFVLEAYKTHPAIGSWAYPEFGYFKLFNVPLYSGFMYAAVGSYMSQAWRILKLRMTKYPSYWLSVPLCIAIYANFFTHYFAPDMRWFLKGLVIIVFGQTTIYFTVLKKERRMPLVVSFVLTAFFIWVAENISSFYGAWKYPHQLETWGLVSFQKVSSWSLLVIISFIIVANLKLLKADLKKG